MWEITKALQVNRLQCLFDKFNSRFAGMAGPNQQPLCPCQGAACLVYIIPISRELLYTGTRDYPITRLAPGDAEIAFTGYFDWDDHALIDFRYYRGEILQCSKHPQIVGHELLIETQYADIFYIPEAVQ